MSDEMRKEMETWYQESVVFGQKQSKEQGIEIGERMSGMRLIFYKNIS